MQDPTELLPQNHEVDDGLARDAAALVIGGNQHGYPAQIGCRMPKLVIEHLRFLECRTPCRQRLPVVEESTGALAQEVLILV